MEENGYRTDVNEEMEEVVDIMLPRMASPSFWSAIGPRAIITIAFVSLMLPDTVEFYINLKPRNTQYPSRRIRVMLHNRWRPYNPYIPNPFAANRHFHHEGVANSRQRATG